MILPSIGLSYNDPNDLITDLDKVSDIINQSSKGDYSNIGELNKSLTAMQGDVLNAELGGVVALPFLTNLFLLTFLVKPTLNPLFHRLLIAVSVRMIFVS